MRNTAIMLLLWRTKTTLPFCGIFCAHFDLAARIGSSHFRLVRLGCMQSHTYQYESQTNQGVVDTSTASKNLITVFDGTVVSSLVRSSDAVALSNTPTIDNLLCRIQAANDLPACSMQVAYYEMAGYPHDVHVDYVDRIANIRH